MAEIDWAITDTEYRRRVSRAAAGLHITFETMLTIGALDPGDLHAARVSIGGGRLWPDVEVDE